MGIKEFRKGLTFLLIGDVIGFRSLPTGRQHLRTSSFEAASPEMLATCRQRAKAYHITNEQKCKTFPEFFYTHWTTA
ncbi:hypothetical protein QCD79_31200, partial [Pseudomonas quasicaspiana]|nr:hypothetical protein [Pseudomonas quasicaspiana]